MRRRLDNLRSRFWVIPAACCVTALLLALGLPELDRRVSGDLFLLFPAGAAGARSLLSAIATAMISFTGLVFSITVVVLQLASSQFSPRVLRTFLRSRTTQLALGVFTATFLYAVVVLRVTGGVSGGSPFVPQLAVTGAFLLVLASVAAFIRYIFHITQSIRVLTIITSVGAETRDLLDARADDGEVRVRTPLPAASRSVPSGRPGILVDVDRAALVALAARHDCVVEVRLAIGMYAPAGQALLTVHGPAAGFDDGRACRALPLGQERTMTGDVAFGFRQLVDIAERALSPAINDPTTAVRALDEMHDLLRRLATRPDPTGQYADDAGRLRLLLPERGFADYLDLALDELLHYGRDSLQVRRRVPELLDDLQTVARPEHRAAIAEKRRSAATAEFG